MRTTITIDDNLFAELMTATQAKTRTEAIHRAVSEWLRWQKIERLMALRGKVAFEGNLEDLRNLEVAEGDLADG